MTRRRLASNTLWNLLGFGAPMVAAVVSAPLLIRGLGPDGFGILTMAWGVIGYFTLFDLGLGRALTQLTAERLNTEREGEIAGLTWTALVLMAAFGLIAAILVALLTPWLTGAVFKMPGEMIEDASASFYLLAVSLPAVTTTAGTRGLLEAAGRFDVLNAIRVPMGLFTFLGPLAVLPFSRSVIVVTAVLVVGRFVAGILHFYLSLRYLPVIRTEIRFQATLVRPLLRFGGWMTISGIASALMVYLDRFVIGAMISLAAVTYYVTPYEMMWRLTMIPSALFTVLFPTFAMSFARDRLQVQSLYDQVSRMVIIVMLPMTLLLATFAEDLLSLWLGADFGLESTRLMQWLALGTFVISHSMLAATGLQGVGRPDLTGKVNLAELPLYMVVLWWFVRTFGIEGAAIAWVLRAGLDALLLGLLVQQQKLVESAALKRITLACLAGIPLFLWGAALETLMSRALFGSAFLALFPIVAWRLLLRGDERDQIRHRLTIRATG